MLNICRGIRIKKHLFCIATTIKSYVSLVSVLWIIQIFLVVIKNCFYQQILQLKKFLLTDLLTLKTFLVIFISFEN